MAANIKDESERLNRIIEVGEYFLNTGASTREIADYFSKNKYSISNKTVYDYIKKYKEMFQNKVSEIEDKLYSNKEKSIDDAGVRERVLTVSRLILDGHTKKEVSKILGITIKEVERDINPRLKKISEIDKDYEIYYNAVMNVLKKNQIDALNEYRNIKHKK